MQTHYVLGEVRYLLFGQSPEESLPHERLAVRFLRDNVGPGMLMILFPTNISWTRSASLPTTRPVSTEPSRVVMRVAPMLGFIRR